MLLHSQVWSIAIIGEVQKQQHIMIPKRPPFEKKSREIKILFASKIRRKNSWKYIPFLLISSFNFKTFEKSRYFLLHTDLLNQLQ